MVTQAERVVRVRTVITARTEQQVRVRKTRWRIVRQNQKQATHVRDVTLVITKTGRVVRSVRQVIIVRTISIYTNARAEKIAEQEQQSVVPYVRQVSI